MLTVIIMKYSAINQNVEITQILHIYIQYIYI